MGLLDGLFGKKEVSSMDLIAECVTLADELAHIDDIDEIQTRFFEELEEAFRGLKKFAKEKDPKQINIELAQITSIMRSLRGLRHPKFVELKAKYSQLKKVLQR